MKAHQEHLDKTTPAAKNAASDQNKMNRREALAIVGKHAVYTAPAVLAVLAATKSNRVHAGDGDPSPN
ncbi:MAG: hypothetical protein AW11_01232 [Candidatus Accumulibacter regalis]|uniref:Uncharacterized protein n=1 Tax=Accumulibacter regalis TaxID=522306 RepID=A0A011QK32_ACCRE|nr:hypothetical protein [Accumulibacter sp.]EXI89742.1 MAG: hypothetical protein AW11_01232 [Candidatus Accumulibacter regalis]HRE70557.1 hypothetical protein [Accumulibacter sp.]